MKVTQASASVLQPEKRAGTRRGLNRQPILLSFSLTRTGL